MKHPLELRKAARRLFEKGVRALPTAPPPNEFSLLFGEAVASRVTFTGLSTKLARPALSLAAISNGDGVWRGDGHLGSILNWRIGIKSAVPRMLAEIPSGQAEGWESDREGDTVKPFSRAGSLPKEGLLP